MSQPTYTVVLQPARAGDDGVRGLRRLLKALLCRHALRCISISEMENGDPVGRGRRSLGSLSDIGPQHCGEPNRAI
jgi:hypothetical protein